MRRNKIDAAPSFSPYLADLGDAYPGLKPWAIMHSRFAAKPDQPARTSASSVESLKSADASRLSPITSHHSTRLMLACIELGEMLMAGLSRLTCEAQPSTDQTVTGLWKLFTRWIYSNASITSCFESRTSSTITGGALFATLRGFRL